MSRNKRFIKEKPGEKVKGILLLIIIFAWMGIPALILSNPHSIKADFFAYTVMDSFFVVFLFILGLLCIFVKTEKKVKLSSKILGVVFFGGSILLSIPVSNYYKDIPKIINSNYSFYKGNLTDVQIKSGRGVTLTTITIKNEKFELHSILSPSFTIIGKEYYVTFLPNTKFVISLETQKNATIQLLPFKTSKK
jgi:hypothetical protein